MDGWLCCFAYDMQTNDKIQKVPPHLLTPECTNESHFLCRRSFAAVIPESQSDLRWHSICPTERFFHRHHIIHQLFNKRLCRKSFHGYLDGTEHRASADLIKMYRKKKAETESARWAQVTSYCHSRGLNMAFLFVLRAFFPSSFWSHNCICRASWHGWEGLLGRVYATWLNVWFCSLGGNER